MNLEFNIFFIANPTVFVLMIMILGVMILVWIAKFIISMYTGAGGS